MGPVEVKILLSLGGWLSHGQSCHISYFYIIHLKEITNLSNISMVLFIVYVKYHAKPFVFHMQVGHIKCKIYVFNDKKSYYTENCKR